VLPEQPTALFNCEELTGATEYLMLYTRCHVTDTDVITTRFDCTSIFR